MHRRFSCRQLVFAIWLPLVGFCSLLQAAYSSKLPAQEYTKRVQHSTLAALSTQHQALPSAALRKLRSLLPVPAPSLLLESYPALQSGAAVQHLMPQVHGYVSKSGMADVLAWSQKSQYALARKAVFEQWRRDNDSVAILHPGPLSCASARHPPVPYPHCQVFVNHNYKIAYIRSPKSSSTSIMDWLGQCNFNKTRNWNASTCLQYSWEKYETQEQIATIWQDYFFFGFIRNPWNRAYSLYKDLTSTGHFSKFHGPLCHLQWGKFCQDPFAEVQKLHARGCMRVDELYSYWHMMDQYHCMVTPTGDWAVDFLGRVEAGDEDWRVVVEEMNRRRRPGVPEVQYSSYGVANAVSSAASAPSQHAEQRYRYHRHSGGWTRLHRRRRPASRRLSTGPGFSETQEHSEHELASYGGSSSSNSSRPASTDCSTSPDHPYCGETAHCLDAVSQWYACDAEKFGYLPMAAAPSDAAVSAAPDTDQSAAGVQATTAIAVPTVVPS